MSKVKLEKRWNRENIRSIMLKNDKQLIKMLLVVYNNQTTSEQAIGHTIQHNNIGFNGSDSNFLSSLAEQIIKRKDMNFAEDKLLSDKQMFLLRKKMLKYANQLANEANQRERIKNLNT